MLRAVILMGALSLGLGAQSLDQARTAYERTAYDQALRTLENLPDSAAVYALRGQSYYGKGDFRAASEALEKATESAPGNSSYWDWLGKAYGRRAERANFLSAARWASRCHRAFERAVELDPKNLDAASDLFAYYMEAPGIMGGGTGKARDLAEKMLPVSQAQYEYFQAELAQDEQDWAAAEQHLRKAAELEPANPARLTDLAWFLAARGRYQESDRAFDQAAAMTPPSPAVNFERAAVLVEHKRNLPEARRLLAEYQQATNLTPKDPARWEAEELLKRAN